MPVAWVSRSVKCADGDADLLSTPDSGFRFRWSDCCFRWDSAFQYSWSGVVVSGGSWLVGIGCVPISGVVWGVSDARLPMLYRGLYFNVFLSSEHEHSILYLWFAAIPISLEPVFSDFSVL